MEKLTTTMKDAIKDRIDNITKIAKDYRNIIDHDYQFDDGTEESTFYFKFNRAKSELVKIENILDDIYHARNYIEIGLEFLDWADNYFQNNFNKIINREEAFKNYKDSLPFYRCKSRLNILDFIKKVQLWCQIKGHTYNPERIMKQGTEIERNRNEIRFMKVTCDDEKICYGFYIGNKEEDNQ